MSINIPDYFSPLVGFRAWANFDHHTGGLKAIANNYYWLPKIVMECRCDSCGGKSMPRMENSQGFYAFATLEQLLDDSTDIYPILGEVYLWGQLVEASRGWRAQFAYPKSLLVNSEAMAKELSKHWSHIPIEVGNIRQIMRQLKEEKWQSS